MPARTFTVALSGTRTNPSAYIVQPGEQVLIEPLSGNAANVTVSTQSADEAARGQGIVLSKTALPRIVRVENLADLWLSATGTDGILITVQPENAAGGSGNSNSGAHNQLARPGGGSQF